MGAENMSGFGPLQLALARVESISRATTGFAEAFLAIRDPNRPLQPAKEFEADLVSVLHEFSDELDEHVLRIPVHIDAVRDQLSGRYGSLPPTAKNEGVRVMGALSASMDRMGTMMAKTADRLRADLGAWPDDANSANAQLVSSLDATAHMTTRVQNTLGEILAEIGGLL